MKFKIDENLPVEVAELLRQAGYDTTTAVEQHLEGENDAHSASACQHEERALVTLDTDFADIRTYPPREYSGLVVLRLKGQDKPHVLEIMAHLVPVFARESLEHHLWIVE
jgi:predicted nuclease of predicted toxin-antitoxin system